MNYLFLALFLFLIEVIYIRIAVKLFIIDNPNSRSSHEIPTIRGGGIVIWFAGLAYFIISFPGNIFFFAGLTIVAATGLADDIKPRSPLFRLTGQIIAVSLILLQVFHFEPQSSSDLTPHPASLHPTSLMLIIIAAYILFTGILNAYNFMDGINGMTGLYSISVLGALQYVNLNVMRLTEPDFIRFPVIACTVFLFFNLRKKALCFAGDTGSLAIAFWIIYIILMLIIKTGSIAWLLFLAVYGADSVFTILHRLWLRQNIFRAHRLHFYQILANEKGIDHRIVSAAYAVVQAAISASVIVLWDKWPLCLLAGVVLVPLAGVYFLKFRFSRIGNEVNQ